MLTDKKCAAVSQFGWPRGLKGRLVGWAMAAKNGPNNRAALAQVAARPGERVLEIGCGPGVALHQVATAVGPTGFAAGVDRSAVMVGQARRRNRRFIRIGCADVTEGDAASLPFENDSFDKAYAVNCVRFWTDPERPLAEVRRVLRPGGIFVVGERTPGEAPARDYAGAGAGAKAVQRIEKALAKAGFENLSVTTVPAGSNCATVICAQLRPACTVGRATH